MSRYPIILLLVASLIILGSLFLIAGCSDNDPLTPVHLPEDGYLAVSPDSLMALWQTALTTMDSTMYRDIYEPDFRFHFSASDTSEFQLLTEYMTRDETVQTGWNMFSGQDVTNWKGTVVPGVVRIYFPVMTQETSWAIAGEGSAYPGARHARFAIQMYVERSYGITTIFAVGSYDFYAVPRDTIIEDGTISEYFRLLGMVAVNPGEKTGVISTWGGVHMTYMTNEAPDAVLEVTDIGGSPLPVFQCDASGSSDADSGLHTESYSWRFKSEGVWTGWTEWTEEPTISHAPSVPGDHTISVQVRDRWGLTNASEYDVIVIPVLSLPFPGSRDQLMANFQTIYETRDFDEYRTIMHPDFLTILQENTTEEFPDVGTTLDVNEELRIHERMFSGEDVTDPQGDLVPGVLNISFDTFRALGAWTMSPANDIIPNAEWAPFDIVFLFDRGQSYTTLMVVGTIKFYVTSRDSLHQGETKQYYQMIGQVDLTSLE